MRRYSLPTFTGAKAVDAHRVGSYRVPLVWIGLLALAVAACFDSLATELTVGPNGALAVTTATTGTNLDPDGYFVAIDGAASQSIGLNATITFSNLEAGDYNVRITGLANNCTVNGQNPRTVTVIDGDTAQTTFEVTCTDVTGDLVVTAQTSGDDLDPDGYVVTVDGSQSQAIGINGLVTFRDLAVGNRSVELTGVAGNCGVSGQNPRTVTVSDGGTAQTTFQVSCGAQTGSLALWGLAELSFTGPAGTSNPFRDVSGSVTFTGPSSHEFTVDLFYDGDGQGGQSGTVWKARFMPDEVGSWNWSSSSAAPELDSKSGNLTVTDQGSAAPFEIDPVYPRYFRRKTGEHEYLAGNWLYQPTGTPGGQNNKAMAINYLAHSGNTAFTTAQRQEIRDVHKARGMNQLGVYLSNNGDQQGTAFVDPFLADDVYDLNIWHDVIERRLDELDVADLYYELWLTADENFGLSATDWKAFARYAYARLAARRRVIGWVIGLEASEYWSQSGRNERGNFLQSINSYGQPIASHHPEDNLDRHESWCTYVPVQIATWADFDNWSRQLEETNADVNKPVQATEFIEEGRPPTNPSGGEGAIRQLTWIAFTSGAYMVSNTPDNAADPSTPPTTDYAKHFTDYVNGSTAPGSRPEWWKMTPNRSLVTSGTGYLLRQANTRYLAYLPAGGSVTINLSEASGSFSYDWYNPRNGTITAGGTVSGGNSHNFSSPNSNDWLLDIRK